jgi:hypothetical protein
MASPKLTVGLLLYSVALCAQVDESIYNSSYAFTMDTLTLNNCPAELLWSEFGLEKEAVFELVEYRSSVGQIKDPSELKGMVHLDSVTISRLLQALPLTLPARKKNKLSSLSTVQLGAKNSFSQRLDGRVENIQFGVKCKPREKVPMHGFISQQYPTKFGEHIFLLGTHRVEVGQGILNAYESFPSPTSEEKFGRGIVGSSAEGNRFGWAQSLHWRSCDLGWSHDRKGDLWFVQQTLPAGNIGFASQEGQWTFYSKYYVGSLRLFGELGSQGSRLGLNFWSKDVLIEGNASCIANELSFWFYLSGRNSSGNWNLKWQPEKIKFSWSKGPFQYQLSQHPSKDLLNSTVRQKLRWDSGFGTLDLHWHAHTIGISFRSFQEWQSWRITQQWGMIQAEDNPVWVAVPLLTGSIGSKAIYSDFVGLHLKAQNAGFQLTGRLDFTKNLKDGIQLGAATTFIPSKKWRTSNVPKIQDNF